jgi:hypothetical protein
LSPLLAAARSKKMDVASFVLEILTRAAPELYAYIKSEIDGGADAEELRKQDISVSIAFGGGPGEALVIQSKLEADMLNPDQE